MTKTLKLGIAGLGTVGVGTIELLAKNAEVIAARIQKDVQIVAVSSRDKTKDRGLGDALNGVRWVDDACDLAEDPEVDVVIELIGGSEGVARSLVERSLKAGKHVVTANKALIAHHGAELAALADENGVSLLFEAAVAGGIPAVKMLREGLSGNQFRRISGILNGTCNYILTNMEETGRSFSEVLVEAQEKGYAEADPSFDVDGVDAAHKLAILASLAYGVAPTMDDLFVEGIRHITFEDILFARDLGYSIRLLGIAQAMDGGIERRVHPCLVPEANALGQVSDVFNAVQFDGDPVDSIFLKGRGAGAGPTASSVVADVVDIARGISVPILNHTDSSLKTVTFSSMCGVQTRYYLRIEVEDHTGVIANVSGILSEAGVSVEVLMQPPHEESDPAQIVLITHITTEAVMQKAIDEIAALDEVMKPPRMIGIER